MKNLALILLLAITGSTTATGQDLVTFDSYTAAPSGTRVFSEYLEKATRSGDLEYGVMYKGDDGYGMTYKLDMSNFEKTDDILKLTHDILIDNNKDPNSPDHDWSDMELDFENYDMELMWVDFYLNSEVGKAWEIDVDGKNYVVFLQMNYNYSQVTLTEYKKN